MVLNCTSSPSSKLNLGLRSKLRLWSCRDAEYAALWLVKIAISWDLIGLILLPLEKNGCHDNKSQNIAQWAQIFRDLYKIRDKIAFNKCFLAYTFFYISIPFFSAQAEQACPNTCFQPQMCLRCASSGYLIFHKISIIIA